MGGDDTLTAADSRAPTLAADARTLKGKLNGILCCAEEVAPHRRLPRWIAFPIVVHPRDLVKAGLARGARSFLKKGKKTNTTVGPQHREHDGWLRPYPDGLKRPLARADGARRFLLLVVHFHWRLGVV